MPTVEECISPTVVSMGSLYGPKQFPATCRQLFCLAHAADPSLATIRRRRWRAVARHIRLMLTLRRLAWPWLRRRRFLLRHKFLFTLNIGRANSGVTYRLFLLRGRWRRSMIRHTTGDRVIGPTRLIATWLRLHRTMLRFWRHLFFTHAINPCL